MTTTFDRYSDVIDSRDVIARIEELRDMETRDDDERAELLALVALQDDAEGYSEDWQYGATLIRSTYFKEYAQELAEDCGMVPDNLAWPCTCIDWEQAARELQQDYTSVEFCGIGYWIR